MPNPPKPEEVVVAVEAEVVVADVVESEPNPKALKLNDASAEVAESAVGDFVTSPNGKLVAGVVVVATVAGVADTVVELVGETADVSEGGVGGRSSAFD